MAQPVPLSQRPWYHRRACQDVDPDVFFPDKGSSTKEAKRICAGCPVLEECRAYALENGERYGVWGGLGERERRRLLGPRPSAPAWQARKTHCKNGHPFEGDNLLRSKRGRACRACSVEATARYKARQTVSR